MVSVYYKGGIVLISHYYGLNLTIHLKSNQPDYPSELPREVKQPSTKHVFTICSQTDGYQEHSFTMSFQTHVSQKRMYFIRSSNFPGKMRFSHIWRRMVNSWQSCVYMRCTFCCVRIHSTKKKQVFENFESVQAFKL